MQAIAGRLKAGHILLKYRDSAAQDVEGGCGQLRARVAAEEGLRQKDSQ
jgi:23S rRNA (adenine2503-C2)-methyltransferase